MLVRKNSGKGQFFLPFKNWTKEKVRILSWKTGWWGLCTWVYHECLEHRRNNRRKSQGRNDSSWGHRERSQSTVLWGRMVACSRAGWYKKILFNWAISVFGSVSGRSTMHYSRLTILAAEVSLLADKGKSLKWEKYEYFRKILKGPPFWIRRNKIYLQENGRGAKKRFCLTFWKHK